MLAATGCVVGECDVREASGKAPRMPAADTSLDSTFNAEVQAGPRFLEPFMTIRASNSFPRHATPISASSKNPMDPRDASAASRITVSGKPRHLQMKTGGEWKNEVWADLRPERIIRSQFQGGGTLP